MGGLGNQLFQYAAAKAVAEAKGYKVLVERELGNAHNHSGQDYVSLLMRDAEEVDSLSDKVDEAVYFFEEAHTLAPWSVDQIHSAANQPIRMRGYFQYLPPLRGVLPGIRSMLCEALRPQQETVTARYSLHNHETAVFMHVRRGDYTALPHFHYLQDETYYETAVSLLRKKMPVEKVFVLSDDMDWCTTRKWTFEMVSVDEPDELMCLALMSLCKGGAIIGNSTFSWWGAVLGDAPHVYYPSRWINLTMYDLFPSHWTRI